MGEPLGDRAHEEPDPRPDAVVRPLARAGGRTCARPGCPAPASATLIFDYPARHASLGVLDDRFLPESYDLCGHHADRTGAPIGWLFEDLRPDGMRPAPAPDDATTVDILTRALRADSDDGDAPLLNALESMDLLLGGDDQPDNGRRVVADAQDTIDELQAFISAQDTMEELRALLAAPQAGAPAAADVAAAAPPATTVADVVSSPAAAVASSAPVAVTAYEPAAPPAPPTIVVQPLGARAQAW